MPCVHLASPRVRVQASAAVAALASLKSVRGRMELVGRRPNGAESTWIMPTLRLHLEPHSRL